MTFQEVVEIFGGDIERAKRYWAMHAPALARTGPLADATGTTGKEAWMATDPFIKTIREDMGPLQDATVLRNLANREEAPLPVTPTDRKFYDKSAMRGSLFPGPRPSLESHTTPIDRSFYDVESKRDPVFPGPRPSLESRTTPTDRQFYDLEKRRDPLFPGPRPSLESRRLPLTIEIEKKAEEKKDLGLTSFSDRLKALDIQGINAVLPYPTMSAGVTKNRKKLQRQRDTFRALMGLNPVDMVWSDNLSTSQLEDRWTRRRKQYMSKLLQLTRPQSRREVNALAGAAGLDTDEWKEMLEVFDSSRQDLTYKKGQIDIEELIEKGLIEQAAREFMTGLPLHVIQNPDLFTREVHLFQQQRPLASGTDFVNEVQKQLEMVRHTPKNADLVTLTNGDDGTSHMGYVTYNSRGIPSYYLSETNKKLPSLQGWSVSSPHATQIDVDVDAGPVEPSRAMKMNLAAGALRNVNYALSEFLDSQGNLKVGMIQRWTASKNVPGSRGRYLRQIMANAIGDSLRLESGAAIPPDELMQMIERYMPLPGDTADSQKYKIREFWERAVGLVRLALPDLPIPNPVWAPAILETLDQMEKLPPGSYFQTEKMRKQGKMGRSPGGEIGF